MRYRSEERNNYELKANFERYQAWLRRAAEKEDWEALQAFDTREVMDRTELDKWLDELKEPFEIHFRIP